MADCRVSTCTANHSRLSNTYNKEKHVSSITLSLPYNRTLLKPKPSYRHQGPGGNNAHEENRLYNGLPYLFFPPLLIGG